MGRPTPEENHILCGFQDWGPGHANLGLCLGSEMSNTRVFATRKDRVRMCHQHHVVQLNV